MDPTTSEFPPSSALAPSMESEQDTVPPVVAQFSRFSLLPMELQVDILERALGRPGLEFFNMYDTHGGLDSMDINDLNSNHRRFVTLAPCPPVHLLREQVGQLCQAGRLALGSYRRTMARPFTFVVEGLCHDGQSRSKKVAIDGASDVVYIKQGYNQAWNEPLPSSKPCTRPDWIMGVRFGEIPKGVSRVALEVPPSVWKPCQWAEPTCEEALQAGWNCVLCGGNFEDHNGADRNAKLDYLAKLLLCFEGLDETILVLCEMPHEPKLARLGRCYVASGDPRPANENRKLLEERLVEKPALEFQPGYGVVLREITDRAILDRVFHLADTIQRKYMIEDRGRVEVMFGWWYRGALEEEVTRVKFRLASWETSPNHF